MTFLLKYLISECGVLKPLEHDLSFLNTITFNLRWSIKKKYSCETIISTLTKCTYLDSKRYDLNDVYNHCSDKCCSSVNDRLLTMK